MKTKSIFIAFFPFGLKICFAQTAFKVEVKGKESCYFLVLAARRSLMKQWPNFLNERMSCFLLCWIWECPTNRNPLATIKDQVISIKQKKNATLIGHSLEGTVVVSLRKPICSKN
jgi:cellulose synthase/poly-beta-1,6-N-acetylglucosamine synthase-like glycosyltransferase